MKAIPILCIAAMFAAPAWTAAQAAASGAEQRAAARAAIAQERADNDKLLEENEKICYQRFAVTDCLKKVRGQSYAQERALRKRELAINAQERDERTAEQRAARAKKQQDFDNKRHSNPLDGGALQEPDLDQRKRQHDAAAAERAQGHAEPHDRAAQQQQRQQDAAKRAAEAEKKAQSKQHSQQSRAASTAAGVNDARAEFDAKQAEAAQRQAAHAQKMQELEARGKKVAPLPTPP